MTKVISISVRPEDEWIIDEMRQLGSNFSANAVAAMRDYLETQGGTVKGLKPPYWYVPGKDYSKTLSKAERLELVQFGYSDDEVP